MPDIRPPVVHFGGPDRPPRALRGLLRARIEAVPPGGSISWATYYFRDRDLAEALVAANDRGVVVDLSLEGEPRRRGANAAVIAMLARHGLRGGLRIHAARFPPVFGKPVHLHSKIYAFSHPEPSVLIGSFNPSGDDPEDPEVIAEIGDQDRGHNLLAEFFDPRLVEAMARQARRAGRPALRLLPSQNRAVAAGLTTAWFYPRIRPGILEAHLRALAPGCALRGAISHLKAGAIEGHLAEAARRGARIRLLVHDTERRVPGDVIEELGSAGVSISRYAHPEGLPIHAKFLLIEEPGRVTGYFGSYNFNRRSRLYNAEVLLASRDPAIVNPLARRFEEIEAEIAGMAP
jgi:PLD-like domain